MTTPNTKRELKRFDHLKPLALPARSELHEYQKLAANFAAFQSASYLALDPGLGKTVIAARVIDIWNQTALKIPTTQKQLTIYVSPPFLAPNVRAELLKWCESIDSYMATEQVVIFNSQLKALPRNLLVLIIPDTLLSQFLAFYHSEKPDSVLKSAPTSLIVDEAHRFKSLKSIRTKTLLGRDSLVSLLKPSRSVLMSGTPMPNRPIELYPVLARFAPEVIEHRSFSQFIDRYCDAKLVAGHMDYSGASNVAELATNMRKRFMLRLKKEDVLKELPTKSAEVVVINEESAQDGELLNEVKALDRQLRLDHSHLIFKSQFAELAFNGSVSTYRRKLGELKARAAILFLENELELAQLTGEKFIVFTVHRNVLAVLSEHFKETPHLTISGDDSAEARTKKVAEFQTPGGPKLLLANLIACGVGFTLTQATRVVFVEFSWVPSDNYQAEDRTHRIGQTKNVRVQYLVYPDSIDYVILKTILKKLETTSQF